MPVFFSRAAREDRVLCVGMQCGGFSGFAALHYDLRHLLRYFCCAAAMIAALRGLRRKG